DRLAAARFVVNAPFERRHAVLPEPLLRQLAGVPLPLHAPDEISARAYAALLVDRVAVGDERHELLAEPTSQMRCPSEDGERPIEQILLARGLHRPDETDR